MNHPLLPRRNQGWFISDDGCFASPLALRYVRRSTGDRDTPRNEEVITYHGCGGAELPVILIAAPRHTTSHVGTVFDRSIARRYPMNVGLPDLNALLQPILTWALAGI